MPSAHPKRPKRPRVKKVAVPKAHAPKHSAKAAHKQVHKAVRKVVHAAKKHR